MDEQKQRVSDMVAAVRMAFDDKAYQKFLRK